MLAGAGPQVRAELLTQVPSESASLIDALLDGASTPAPTLVDNPRAGLNAEVVLFDAIVGEASPQQASDALRYGILKDEADALTYFDAHRADYKTKPKFVLDTSA